TLQLLKIKIPDETSLQRAPVDVPNRRDYWQAFLRRNKACLLQVHSVILPHSFNILINPRHEDAGKIEVDGAERFTVDPRFQF
ncbi:MAG: RES family NAD+ phosphorylase, partial [Pseudomonadota bacterium]